MDMSRLLSVMGTLRARRPGRDHGDGPCRVRNRFPATGAGSAPSDRFRRSGLPRLDVAAPPLPWRRRSPSLPSRLRSRHRVRAAEAPGPGSPGIGDPYFPLDGNGGIDVAALRRPRHLPLRDRPAVAAGPGSRCGPPRTCRRSTSTSCSRCGRVTVDGAAGDVQPTGGHELRIVRRHVIRGGQTVRVRVGVRRSARRATLARRAQLAGRRRRGRGHERAAHGALVVPRQRPPARQGADGHPHHRAARASRSSPTAGWSGAPSHGDRATYHWRADEPMATYLAFFAAGRFAVRQGAAHGLPCYVAVSRGLPRRAAEPR